MLLCVKCSCSSTVGDIRNTADVDNVQLQDSFHSLVLNEANNHRPTATATSSSLAAAAAAAAESESAAQVSSGAERLLVKIHDLMQANARTKARLRREKDENEKLMNDWMIAAAVIDRISFIFIAIFFVAATVIFMMLSFIPRV